MKSKYLLIAILLCLMQQLLAQPKGEKIVFPSPQASQLGKFGGVNLNYSSGSPNVAIPIYTATEGNLEIPISLGYQYSGYKPSDLPGWCGIGWSLQAGGVITRMVKGRRDEISGIGYLSNGGDISAFVESTPTYVTYQELGIRENNKDNHPDLFSFQFMGHSGKFVFTETGEPRVLSDQKIGITYVKGTEPIYNDINSIISWTIVTEDGTKFTFGRYELSSAGDSGNTWDITSWYLTEIISSKGDRVTFEYSAINTGAGRMQLGRSDKIAITSVGTALSTTSTTNLASNVSMEIYLQKIKGSLWEITFNSSAYVNPVLGNGRKLDDIQVNNANPSSLLKKFLFVYDSNNLQLLSVGEEGKPAYQMLYYGAIPSINGHTTQVDYWGFYNGQTNTSLIPGDYTNDLEPRAALTMIGALQQITYPTKGLTKFEYEQNDYSYFANQLSPFSTIVVENYGYSWQRTSSGLTTGANPPFTLTGPTRVDVVVNVPPGGPFSECNNLNQDSFSLTLPKGTYTGENLLSNNAFYPCNGRINQIGFNVGLTVKVFRETTSNVANYGGVRVKNIKEYTAESATPTIKVYEYKDASNASLSSGVLGQKPVYRLPFSTGENGPFEIYCSAPFNPFGSFAHYYKDVKEISADFATQYSFTSHMDYTDIFGKYAFTSDYVEGTGLLSISSTQVSDLGGFQSYDFMRSLPKKTIVRDLSGNIKQETVYSYINTDLKKIPALHHEFLTTYPVEPDHTVRLYYTKAYYLVVGWPRKISETVTDYGSAGENSVTTTTNFSYGTNHLQLNKERVTRSDGSVLETNYKFPLDYLSGGNSTLQAMITDNMVTYPVETVTYLEKSASDRKVIDANLTIYGNFTGNANKGTLYLPQKEFRFRGFDGAIGNFGAYNGSAEPVSGSSSYDEVYRTSNYDTQGNPLSVLLNGSEKVSYLWGYKGQFPVAQIRNADYAAVNSALSSAGSSFSALSSLTSSSDIQSKVDAVRNNLTGALVTGYTYKPLVGMESMTDPATKKTWYNYDNFERLSDIRENNSTGNLIKSFHYNYANQGGFVNGIVDNPDVSAPFTPGLISGGSSDNQCTANLVKLLFRTADRGRLAGATIQGSNNGVDWEVLYTFLDPAPADGSWVRVSFSNPQQYRHIRYNARNPDGVGDLREIRFYYLDANGNEYALSGTGFGSEPNIAGLGWQKAMDGDEATAWHAEYTAPLGHAGNSNFVGISLPCATTLITPALYKSTNGDVCANGSPITLTASGFSGQLEWYLNDVLITGTQPGQTQYVATIAGSYKVRSKSGSSYSGFSNTTVLNQKAGCAPPNYSRVVIVGNSITKLIPQTGSDGWQSPALSAAGGWGRASSTQAKDFAHILEARFKGLDPNAQVLPLWEAPFERDYISSPAGWVTYDFTALQNRIKNSFGSSSWKPDLVIIRLGENVLNSEVEVNNFKAAYNTLINKVLEVSTPGAKVIVTNSMWPDQPLANEKIEQVATERGLPFVDLSDMISNPVYLAGNDPVSMAAFPNNTGDRHPGDAGMLEIADRIWSKVKNVNLPSNVGGNITKVRLSPRTQCCIERITGSVIQGSNDISNANGWTTLLEIKDTLVAGWNEYAIRTTTKWRYVRFLAGPKCFGELKELEFYNGNVKLTGTTFGSAAAYNNDPANYGYAVAFDGLVTNSWHGTTAGPTNYAGLDLGGCSTPTASMISPANNASVVGTRSTTNPGRVMIPISVRTCAPAGTTITGVEIWATTTSGAWDNRMGYAIADPSEAGVYKLYAEEATTPGTLGKWVSPIPIDPGTYRFYARVYVGTTKYDSDSLTVTLTAPPATGNITKVRLSPRTQCCIERITGSVIQGSNDISNANGWTTLLEIKDTLVAGWNEYAIRTTTKWRYVRFLAGPKCFGELKELEFYNGNVKLTGTTFGSAAAYNNDPANYGYAVAFDGLVTNSWHGTTAGPTNYAGLDLGGCSTPTASMISPANNASVVGTRSTTNPGRVMIPISVRTCAPAGTTITGVEIWATTTSGAWDNRMGYAIADPSEAGVYKLYAEEATTPGTLGKWVSPIPIDPGTYRFYARVYVGTTKYDSDSLTVTLTAPPATGNITKVRLHTRPETCCTGRISSSVIQGSNDISNANGWTTLTTITGTPAFGWNEYPISTTTTWRYVRFLADSDCYGDLQELEFYNGNVKLSGSGFGSSTAYTNDPAKWGYAVVFDGQVGQTANVWSGTAPGPQNYVGLDLAGCSTVTASMQSPANNASVVGTRSTTNPGRVMIPISVRTCAPAGTTITGVEIWATTTSGAWDNRMGYAIADASQAGVYKLSAEEATTPGTLGKWVSPIPIDPGTYRFYARVYVGTTKYDSDSLTVTLTAPPATGNITKVRLHTRPETCCTGRISSSVIQGSNDISNANGWTTLTTITGTPAFGWNEYPISTTTTWRYVRFLADSDCYGDLQELEFYNGNVKLSGSGFGSSTAYTNDPAKWGYAVVFDGQVGQTANVWSGTAPGPQNYVGLDLAGCSTVTASMQSPANNASVVGTRSTTNPGRVMIPISVRTCAPAGTTITGVEIWATTTSGAWDNRMGYAIADASQAGVYKLSAEEATTPGTLGKWVSPIPIDPGTYRFRAIVNTTMGTFETAVNQITLTAP